MIYLNEDLKRKLFLSLIGISILAVFVMLFNLPKVKPPESSQISTDSDGDMIPDNIEKIIGTNANKKDTDGDGYGDLEEIKKGFNPVGKSPTDKLSDSEFASMKEKIKKADEVFYKNNF